MSKSKLTWPKFDMAEDSVLGTIGFVNTDNGPIIVLNFNENGQKFSDFVNGVNSKLTRIPNKQTNADFEGDYRKRASPYDKEFDVIKAVAKLNTKVGPLKGIKVPKGKISDPPGEIKRWENIFNKHSTTFAINKGDLVKLKNGKQRQGVVISYNPGNKLTVEWFHKVFEKPKKSIVLRTSLMKLSIALRREHLSGVIQAFDPKTGTWRRCTFQTKEIRDYMENHSEAIFLPEQYLVEFISSPGRATVGKICHKPGGKLKMNGKGSPFRQRRSIITDDFDAGLEFQNPNWNPGLMETRSQDFEKKRNVKITRGSIDKPAGSHPLDIIKTGDTVRRRRDNQYAPDKGIVISIDRISVIGGKAKVKWFIGKQSKRTKVMITSVKLINLIKCGGTSHKDKRKTI